MIRLVTQDVFGLAFNCARNASALIAEATSPFDPSGPTLTKFYLIDGVAGFAIRPDGELVYVFSIAKGQGDTIVRAAIARGATHLDCFDGYLVALYSRHGFGRVTSLENWTPGGPDVVFMARPGHFLQALGKAESCSGTMGPVATDPITLTGPERKAGGLA